MQVRTSGWDRTAEEVLSGHRLSREEALDVLRAPDDELLAILDASFRVRREHWGRRVRIHVLANARKGGCPEDCHFCSQSTAYRTHVEPEEVVTAERLVEGARGAADARAWKYCIVTATRSPGEKLMVEVCQAVREIKRSLPLLICCSLGLLTRGLADRLRDAGVDRYNHNLETSRRFFSSVCTTHTYDDRLNTLIAARQAGLSLCSGGIVGMGESDEDVVDLAQSLRDLDVDSIPVNFLNPIAGTPLAGQPCLTPSYCLKVLSVFRFLNPSKDIRVAGGREVNLRELQALALYPANSLFAGGYLTTGGQGATAVHDMVRDLGFEIEEMREA